MSAGRAMRTAALGLTLVAAGCGAPPAPISPALAPATESAPRTILVRAENLRLAKEIIARRDRALLPAFSVLMDSANAALTARAATVTDKRDLPPSGDKRDFMSRAPYWWPDTTKPGGLPYVRRDGVVNMASRVDHDGWRWQGMLSRVEALALANYFTGEQRYGEAALRHLRVWFVDPTTRMHPNARFAQSIPGVTEGRGIGIIDLRHMPRLLDALRVLEHTGMLRGSDRDALAAWCREYLTWLRTSENGRAERAEANNHGTWYDAQAAALALFVGDSAFARELIARDAPRRIKAQFAADGSQPLELERTRPLHYSFFTLDAWTQLAEMARHLSVDLWDHESPSGGGIARGLRFIAPYADPSRQWTKPDVAPIDREAFVEPLLRARSVLGDSVFQRAIDALPASLVRTHRAALSHPAARPTATALDTLLDSALDHATGRLHRAATTLDPLDGYPRVTRADGRWEQRPANQWTSGFFAGTLWYMYQLRREPQWRSLAERWTEGLEGVKTITTTHDLGFMLFDSFGHGYLLTGNPRYREIVLQGSRSLATRYNPVVGAIKSWDTEHHPDKRGRWRFPVIVDNLMNLEMLFWASANGGDTAWRRIAERHALTSARAHLRPDGSTAHVALFDPGTGALEGTVTWQGHSDSSAWARGQAWAIHGFTTSHARSRRPELLEAARRASDWFIANLPADAIPYWDFRHPDIPRTERDASAAAIAASGLYDLARYVSADDARRYRDAADRIIGALARDYLTRGTNNAAILQHSVGQRPQNVEIDVGIVYADYYFVEALLRRMGLFLH